MNVQMLEKVGINYSQGVNRLMGKSDIYERLLMKYTSDKSCETALEAVKNEDYKEVMEIVHTLKGVSGNLSVNPIFERCDSIVQRLKANEHAEIAELLGQLSAEQSRICQVITEASST